jgi:tetratricopeptide (TPR) repeat protein
MKMNKLTLIVASLLLCSIGICQVQKNQNHDKFKSCFVEYQKAIGEVNDFPFGEYRSGKKGIALANFHHQLQQVYGNEKALEESLVFLKDFIENDFHAAFVFVLKLKSDVSENLLIQHFTQKEQNFIYQLSDRFSKAWNNGNPIYINYPNNLPQPGFGMKNFGFSKNDIGMDEFYKGTDAQLDKKMDEALKWFKVSAEKGNSDAMLQIGYMYLNGEGVVKNNKEAFEWFKKASEKSNKYATFQIGKMYWDGTYVNTNQNIAKIWFREAALQGNEKASDFLEKNYLANYWSEMN